MYVPGLLRLAESWPLLTDGHLDSKLVNGASKPKGSQPSLLPAMQELPRICVPPTSGKHPPTGLRKARSMREEVVLNPNQVSVWRGASHDVGFKTTEYPIKL